MKGFLQNCVKLSLVFILLAALFGCKPDAVDSSGQPIKISDYRGKWVVIQYWATWCAPCMAQISELNKLLAYYPNQVVVLGVNFDHLTDAVLQNLKQGYGVKYPLLKNFPIEDWGVSKIEKIPALFILDPKGRLKFTFDTVQSFQDLQKTLNLPPVSYQNI